MPIKMLFLWVTSASASQILAAARITPAAIAILEAAYQTPPFAAWHLGPAPTQPPSPYATDSSHEITQYNSWAESSWLPCNPFLPSNSIWGENVFYQPLLFGPAPWNNPTGCSANTEVDGLALNEKKTHDIWKEKGKKLKCQFWMPGEPSMKKLGPEGEMAGWK